MESADTPRAPGRCRAGRRWGRQGGRRCGREEARKNRLVTAGRRNDRDVEGTLALASAATCLLVGRVRGRCRDVREFGKHNYLSSKKNESEVIQ